MLQETDDAGQARYDDPVIGTAYGRLHIDIERLRLLCTKTAWMMGRGKVPNAEASAQKVWPPNWSKGSPTKAYRYSTRAPARIWLPPRAHAGLPGPSRISSA